MQDGFGLVNLVAAPVLERIGRDERLGRDNPRRNRDGKPKSEGMGARSEGDSAGTAENTGTSKSSLHIDLRI